MSAEKVGAADTAEGRTEGLVRCAECKESRAAGDGRSINCMVFHITEPVTAVRLCTAFRPVVQS